MAASDQLQYAIRELSLSRLESFFEKGHHNAMRSDDLLPNGLPPAMFCIQRMYEQQNSRMEFLDHLVRAGWSLISESQDNFGVTALHALVKISASITNPDKESIFRSIAEYLVDCEELTEAGAPDCEAHDGATPLHWATALHNWKPSVPFLLKLGCDPNKKDSRGRTPLHNAASNWSLERVKLLCKYGGDRKIQCDDGLTALDLAAQSQHRTKHGKSDARKIIAYLSCV